MTYRKDFADDETWVELAKKLYIRLPNWATPPDERHMRRWLRKFKVPEKAYLDATGYEALSDFTKYNPDWPLRAWLGLLLEYVVERDEARGVLRAYDRI